MYKRSTAHNELLHYDGMGRALFRRVLTLKERMKDLRDETRQGSKAMPSNGSMLMHPKGAQKSNDVGRIADTLVVEKGLILPEAVENKAKAMKEIEELRHAGRMQEAAEFEDVVCKNWSALNKHWDLYMEVAKRQNEERKNAHNGPKRDGAGDRKLGMEAVKPPVAIEDWLEKKAFSPVEQVG